MLTQLKLSSMETALPEVGQELPFVPLAEPEARVVEPKTRPDPAGPESPFAAGFLIGAAFLMVFWFFNTAVLRYFSVSRETYGLFWPRREWLLAHVIGGSLALVLGLVQFWPTLRRKSPRVHRIIEGVYVLTAFAGAGSAFYLAYHTDFGWMFGTGMAAMSAASIISTGLAAIAALRRMAEQHREWLIRSYVVTFGFVAMRLSIDLLEMKGIGTVTERLTFASWVCWSVPLLLTEMVIQGRKVCALSRKPCSD